MDQVAGDPEWFPHPVRLIGLLSEHGERVLRRAGNTRNTELITGAVLTVGISTMVYFSTRALIRKMNQASMIYGIGTELLLGWTCIAARNLQQEAGAVRHALGAGDILSARQQLSRIVGRDTADLNQSEICRAVIETLAESTSDGVIAPLVYMLLGGVPMAMTYKVINTLDSMIGHRDTRYLYFGKAAARLDDVANYLPSRATALLITSAAHFLKGFDGSAAWNVWRRDAHKHKSPNAGQPESAMAGALGVRLGGTNIYAGERIVSEVMGEEFEDANLLAVDSALGLASIASQLGVIICVLLVTYKQVARKI